MSITITDLSSDQLRRAADVLEQIESLRNELAEIIGNFPSQSGNGIRQKRKISAAGIARIRAAQKARWAKATRTGGQDAKPKRKMSVATKTRLSAIAKARWKRAKAAGKKAL